MSRIGKNPVAVPSGVTVDLKGQAIAAKGPKGQATLTLVDEVVATMEGDAITVAPRDGSREARAAWGMQRSLVANLLTGLSAGFSRKLEVNGVGYRAAVQGKNLQLQLGFSHDVIYPIPDDIEIKCEKPTLIEVTGANKQRVGQIAAEIRAFRPPEPYKGKGVKYDDEYIFRKEGKKK